MAKAHKMARTGKKEQTAADRAAGHCGTHSDMIIGEIKEDDKTTFVIAEDEKGLYLTTPDKVDDGIADVNRYGRPLMRFKSLNDIQKHCKDKKIYLINKEENAA